MLHFFIQVVEDLWKEEIGQNMIQGSEALLTLKGLGIDEEGLVQWLLHNLVEVLGRFPGMLDPLNVFIHNHQTSCIAINNDY